MSTKRYNWSWINRKSENIKLLSREVVLDHPLKHPVTKIRENRNKRLSDKNLTVAIKVKSSGTFSDPLGLINENNDASNLFQKKIIANHVVDDDDWNINYLKSMKKGELESWEVRKKSILTKYSTSETLTMANYFSLQDKAAVTQQHGRGEQSDFDDGILYEVNDISAQDYCQRMINFHQEVIKAWNEDQKVKALKIVIQCSKLLNDSSTASFYPVKFVHITDILDSFSKLVYARLRILCETPTGKIGVDKVIKEFNDDLPLDMVPDTAKETCRNWFYKIASIRELIPRFYVEAAILHSYSFLVAGEYDKIVLRLTKMIRGIGDPLVAIYARCYLCRIGVSLNVNKLDFFKENFYEFLLVHDQIFNQNLHLNKKVELSKYLDAFTPSLEYIVQGIVAYSGVGVCNDVFNICKQKFNNSLLLYVLLASFETPYIMSHVSELIHWISETKNTGIPLSKLLQQLGEHFQISMINNESYITQKLLMEIWRIISSIENSDQFITCVEMWMPISVSYFSLDKINVLLGNIISHLNYDLLYELYYPQLENILRGIMENTSDSDFIALFTMENFLPFVNLFHSESSRTPVCKLVLEHFVKRTPEDISGDSVTENLMVVAKILHNSISAFTVDDERRQISNLICSFITRLYFYKDYEKQLEFYVDARAAFYNFDNVHSILVYKVNKMSMDVLKEVKGRHTNKTTAFIHACVSYSFITIPSIKSELVRMRLYLLSGQTALANQCYGQAYACFESVLSLIPDFPHQIDVDGKPRCAEIYLASYVSEFISILLIVPDCESHGTRVLLRDLIDKLNAYSWEENSIVKSQLYIKSLYMLNTAVQDTYPYHMSTVDSNDVLYSLDDEFIQDIYQICYNVLEEILKHLRSLESQPRKQAELSFSLFNCLLLRADVTEKSTAKLVLNLWNLSMKNSLLDTDLVKRTLEYCRRKQLDVTDEKREIYQKLLSVMMA